MSVGQKTESIEHGAAKQGYRGVVSPFMAFAGILLLALVLRCYALGRDPLWYDEAAYAYLSRKFDLAIFLCRGLLVSPLYYALFALWQKIAVSDAWLRVDAVLFGMATVAVGWNLGKRLAGYRGAWLSALLLATSPLLVYYSRDAKMYALVGLLELGIVSLALQYAEGPAKRWHLALYVLAAAALVYTHPVAPFFLLAVNIAYFALYGLASRKAFYWVGAQASVVAASLPYLMAETRIHDDMAGRYFWAPPPQLESLYHTACNLTAGYGVLPSVRLLSVALAITLCVAALALLREKRRPAALLLAAACVQVALAFVYSRYAHVSIFVDRYLIGSSAPILIVMAAGLASVPWLWLRRGGVLLALALFACSLGDLYAYRFSANSREHLGVYRTFDALGMAAYIHAHAEPGDVVWHPTWTTLMQMRWYVPEYEHVLSDMAGMARKRLDILSPRTEQAAFGLAPREVEPASDGLRRVWLVLDESFPEGTAPYQGFAAWLEQRAGKVAEARFGGRYAASSVALYDFAKPGRLNRHEHTEDDIVTLAKSEMGPLSTTLHSVSNSERYAISVANPNTAPRRVAYEAILSDSTLQAAGFDRALRERSGWLLHPCADARQSRMAMEMRVNAHADASDALIATTRLEAGTYDCYVERIVPGTRFQVPTADVIVQAGPLELVAGAEPEGPKGGWAWRHAGALEVFGGENLPIAVTARDPGSRPEASAVFSRVVFVARDQDQPSAPWRFSGELIAPARETERVEFEPLAGETGKRLEVALSDGVSETHVWTVQNQ